MQAPAMLNGTGHAPEPQSAPSPLSSKTGRRIVSTNVRPPMPLEAAPPAPAGPVCIDPECFANAQEGETIEEKTASIVTHLVDLFESYRDCAQRREIELWWKWVWAAYWGYKRTNLPTEVVIRECFKQMEVWKANVFELVMGGELFCTYKPRQEGADANAEGSTNVVNDQIKRFGSAEQLRFFVELFGFFGTAYAHPQWRMFRRTYHKHDQMHADFQEDTWDRTSSEVQQDSPYVEVFSPEDVFCHPNCNDVRNSPAVFIPKRVSCADIKTLVREGLLDGQAVMDAIVDESNAYAGSTQRELRGIWDENKFDRLVSDYHEYVFMFCQTYGGWEYCVLNDKHLLRAMKIPGGKIEIISASNYPQFKLHWGVPELMIMIEDQRLMNELMNITVSSHFIASNPMFLVQKESLAEFNRVKFKPGGAIPVETMTDVLPLQTSQPQMMLMEAIDWVRANAQIGTGLNDQVSGTGGDEKTATAFQGLKAAANIRIKYKGVILQPALEAIYRALYELNAMYLKNEYKMRITGADGENAFKAYPPTVFGNDIDVETVLGGGQDDNRAREWMEVLKLVPGLPIPVNVQPILDRMFRAMGEKNVRIFRASSKNAQGDALAQIRQFMETGVLPEAKPGDDHNTFIQIFQMALNQPMPDGQPMPPPMQMILQGRLAEHMTFQQQAMAAMQQAQAQQTPAPQKQLPAPQRQANEQTERKFGNAQRGAMQNGPVQNGPVQGKK